MEGIIKFIEVIKLAPLALKLSVALFLAVVVIILFILQLGKEKKEPMESTSQGVGLQIGNIHNIGARRSQQDCFGVSNITNQNEIETRGVLAVLADGMGGLAHGDKVSAITTSYLLHLFNEDIVREPVVGHLLSMVNLANGQVRKFIMENTTEECGSTLIVAYIKKNCLNFVSVGDSRIYLLRKGSLIQLNREHTFGVLLDERIARGECDVARAMDDMRRGYLTSYIGMQRIEQVDYSKNEIKLLAGDRILLMSDGVFNSLSDEEIQSIAGLNAQEGADELERMVIAKGKRHQDNFTAIVISI